MFLTYNYSSSYSSRESLYNKLLNGFHHSLITPYIGYSSGSFYNNFSPSQSSELSLFHSGYQFLPALSPSLLSQLLDFALNNLVQLPDSPKSTVSPKLLHSSDIILSLFSSRLIVDAISRYLGVFPSIQYVSLWKTSSSSDVLRTPEMYWHMDHHGHKFVKVFFYLTDVHLGSGHHEFLINTHNQSSFDCFLSSNYPSFLPFLDLKRKHRGKYQLSDDLLLPLLSNLIQVQGSAGTGFMEDTRGLHRGTSIINASPRIILQALYVPFNSMKDPIDKGSLDLNCIKDIQSSNSYTKIEMSKLFQLIT